MREKLSLLEEDFKVVDEFSVAMTSKANIKNANDKTIKILKGQISKQKRYIK